MKVIHLKTSRVSGHNSDQTANMEVSIVKLEDGKTFENFLSHIRLKGYAVNQPPSIVKAVEKTKDSWKEIDTKPYDAKLKEALKTISSGDVDYKALSEKQAQEVKDLKAQNTTFEERLLALEASGGDVKELKEKLNATEETNKKLASEAEKLKTALDKAKNK